MNFVRTRELIEAIYFFYGEIEWGSIFLRHSKKTGFIELVITIGKSSVTGKQFKISPIFALYT